MTGEQFRDAVAAMGLSQNDYAHLIGASRRAVVHWVTTEPTQPIETLTRLLQERPELIPVLRDIMDRPELPKRPVGRPPKDDDGE